MPSPTAVLFLLMLATAARDCEAVWLHADRIVTSHDPFEPAQCTTDAVQEATLKRFSKLLQFKTVSSSAAPLHVEFPEEWPRLDTFLRTAYARVFTSLTVEKVGAGNLSYLLTWPGSQPSLPPLLFISHLDVVPVAKETLDQWTHPPFSGAVEGGFIWGRGALDVKVGVCGLLEAVDLLLAEGWAPARTLLLAFGQDEEVGGDLGAGETAALLSARNITVDMIWDEGGSISVDGFPPYTFPDTPLALIGTAEKGYATLLLHVLTQGGHSSVPPLDGTSLGAIVGRILTQVSQRPPRSALHQPVTDLLRALADITPGLRGQIFRFAGFPYVSDVATLLLAHDTVETAAMVHTTAAVTGIEAGVAENVLPPGGMVRINFRLLPGDSLESLRTYLNDTLGSDMRYVTLQPSPGQPGTTATPVTPASSPFFQLLRQALLAEWRPAAGPPSRPDAASVSSQGAAHSAAAIPVEVQGEDQARSGSGTPRSSPRGRQNGAGRIGRQWWTQSPGWGPRWRQAHTPRPLTVAPFLMPGGTDSRHYLHLSKGGVLRHVPTSMNRTAGDLARIHGLNERLAVADLARAVCTYKHALQLFSEQQALSL